MKARIVYRLSLAAVGLASAANIGLGFYVLRKAKSPISYNVRIIEPSLPPSVSPSLVVEDPKTNISPESVVSVVQPTPAQRTRVIPYQYFVDGGIPAAFMNRRLYHEGDYTAFGWIVRIWPERIELADGFIDNERRTSNATVSSTASAVSP